MDFWNQAQKDYTFDITDIDVSASDKNVYVGEVVMSNGEVSYDLEFEYDKKSNNLDLTLYEKDYKGQYHEVDLPFDVQRNKNIIAHYIKEDVKELEKAEKGKKENER